MVASSQVTIDWSAVDTVTNFSTVAPLLRSRGVREVVLLTSGYHLRRAELCGRIMLGSEGISVVGTLAAPADADPPPAESLLLVLRDAARAVLYALTGLDLRGFVKWYHPARARQALELR